MAKRTKSEVINELEQAKEQLQKLELRHKETLTKLEVANSIIRAVSTHLSPLKQVTGSNLLGALTAKPMQKTNPLKDKE